jgi:N-carbamoyl-L-amino-acid hydrolase
VGAVRLSPNLINVIAREAKVSVDLRNTSAELLQESEAMLDAFLVSLAKEENVVIQTRQLARTEPVKFDEGVLRHIEAVAAELGHAAIRRMTSGAGHDAQMMARICPAAMIFVPSIKGISHNPAEATAPEHLEIGANVLLRTMMRMANE